MSIPSRRAPLVLFVAFPQVGLLDLTGPQSTFWVASKNLLKAGLPGYERQTVSLHGGLIQTAEGVGVDTRPFSDFDGCEIDTIVVPGAPYILAALDEAEETVDWIRAKSRLARRTTSVCTGAFLLAKAGLLEGKRVATHWAMCEELQRRYPALSLDSEAIYVQQGATWTSAGVTAGIDLALALIEDDCGRPVAMQVAKELVVFLKRPGGSAQHSALLQAQASDTATFDELHLWLADHLGMPGLSVSVLAERVCMSPRNFSRVYKQKTGNSPYKALEMFRVEAARRLLENSGHNVDQIARQCGFADEERMRVAFHRNLGISPSDYRKRYLAGAEAE